MTSSRLTAPGKSGAYEIRYILEGPGGRKVLASSPLAVTQPAATLNAAETAARGSKVYTDRESSSELTVPAEAGEYEIRYVLEAPGGRQVLARRALRVR